MASQALPTPETHTKRRRARPATPTQALLTGRQSHEIFGTPERTLYELYVRGLLPAVRFPGQRRIWYRRSDIEALIANSITTNPAYSTEARP